MNKKSFVAAICFTVLVSASVMAQKSPKIETVTVQNLNSWQESLDLNKRKNGKYNIFISAKDMGGNETIEGPHNIFLDPESDLPVCGITNPVPDMRVVGNLNIVGTCVDDDGVSRVKLILDEGKETETIVDASGKEFWSYYLDTTQLEEGPHTIKVVGYDINEEPVEGHPVTVNWQLDRKLPLTKVVDREMGMLVSGKVTFKGIVNDGNGIKKLEVSTDNGEHFVPVKIAKTKNPVEVTFSFDVDTKKFEDGPAVLWFKATDGATSVGLYSFLYFIDNTSPEVHIASPLETDIKNGIFSVAGSAKDKIGITELSWTFGNESGAFELIPGNPYWKVDLNTIGSKDKARKFTVRAVDRAGNIVEVSRNIQLDQEADKPVVSIIQPKPDEVFGAFDQFTVRGFAKDDDAVQLVKISVDGGEPFVQETRGVFTYNPQLAEGLKTGKHTATVVAVDKNEVEGNPVTVTFYSIGQDALFSGAKITGGKTSENFVNGMEVHPESGSVFEVTANSTVGLKSIHTEITWGKDGIITKDEDAGKAPLSYKISVPVTHDFPKGVVHLKIQATDISDRISEYDAVLYVTNTTVVKGGEPVIVLDDSRILEDGTIINNPEYPASAYLLGANAAKVELVPATSFAKAELSGNQIRLVALDAVGASSDVKIRVTTDKGKTVESKAIRFKADTAVPEVIINEQSSKFIDGRENPVTVSGKVKCETGIGKVTYRVLAAVTEMKGGIIGAVSPRETAPVDVEINKNGEFSFELNSQYFEPGIHIIQVMAESAGGNKAANAVAINTIPDVAAVDGKMPVAKAPAVYWLDSFDVYGFAVYQGILDEAYDNFKIFQRSQMTEGNNLLSMEVLAQGGKAPAAGKFTAVKAPSLDVNIDNINDVPYLSGMPVTLAYGAKDGGKIQLFVKSSVAVSGVSYEISGDEVSGGEVRQTGAARIIKPDASSPDLWIAEIPVGNLPSRVNNFSATVKAGSLSKTVKGAFTTVREYDETAIDDRERIFGFASGEASYDEAAGNYILTGSAAYYFYANLKGPLHVEFAGKSDGLKVDTDGNLIIVTAEKEGLYTGVSVRVKDFYGDAFESEKINLLCDNSAPVLNLVEPVFAQWLGNSVKLSGTAADSMGVRKVEYSLDNGATWLPFTIPAGRNPGVTFGTTVDLKDYPDGLIGIDIRAEDFSGKTSFVHVAGFKDVTPPEVSVVVPAVDDIVNGETLIVFDAKDNGVLAKAEYVTPPVKGQAPKKNPFELAPLSSVLIGTDQNPIDEAMSFVFTDEAGNTTTKEIWDFIIDNESDLPVTEIHVPEDMQVITRDFTISGVVYDDDGDTTMFYKIDNGEYRQLPEMGTNFDIEVALNTLTDNEHTVTMYAVDINGVKGPEVTRTFRISLEEPKGAVELPTIDTHVRERVTLSGWASDKNGIEKVEVSLDSGNSYNDATGTEKWSYTVDSRAIPGGTQVVFLKVTDKYGIQGLYSSLINIDNNAPEINLELPLDDSVTTGNLFFSGFTFDNVGITELYVTIRNLEKAGKADVRKIKIDRVIGETLNISDLENGFYNVELTGKDKAGNATNVSRNIHLDKNRVPATVDILYPMNGEHKNGLFTIYGQSESEFSVEKINLYVDGKFLEETTLTSSGFYKFDMGPDKLEAGLHSYKVGAVLSNGKEITSIEQVITYNPIGPWVTIENFTYGDFATNRPYIRGQAGYSISEDELLLSKTKSATPEQKAAIEAKRVVKVDISFDNGKTFTEVSKKERWFYRIENQDLAEGYHFLLVRATMANGEVAVTRTIIQIDNTAPKIRLIAPVRGGRYNQLLDVSGLSSDDVELKDVSITLRKGDKSAYEVPGFIQGLYLDFHFWGATLFEIGAGLTFFDDNVKLQVQWGQFTQDQRDAVSELLGLSLTDMRYGGDNVMGIKLLANIASLPFSYFFGHDLEWLYASVAVGAQFSWFNQTNSGKTQTLAAMLAQLEFPKVKLQNVKMFSQFSVYFEGSVWFIPTDVSSTVEIKSVVPQFAVGIRTNIF